MRGVRVRVRVRVPLRACGVHVWVECMYLPIMIDFRVPLVQSIFQRSRADDRVHNHEHICLRIGQRSQSIVILLTSSVPKIEVNHLVVHHHIAGVVVKDSWNVVSGKSIRGVANEEGCLANGSITDSYALDCLVHFVVVVAQKRLSWNEYHDDVVYGAYFCGLTRRSLLWAF